jgi:hypothetical protein
MKDTPNDNFGYIQFFLQHKCILKEIILCHFYVVKYANVVIWKI